MKTINEIKNISMEEVNNMSQQELRSLVDETTKKVNTRIVRLKNYFIKNKLPLPTAFREWNVTLRAENKLLNAGMITKEQLKNSHRKLRSDAKSVRKKMNKDIDEEVTIKSKKGISYATLNYKAPENASLSQLRYYFKTMKDFLNSKQGTVTDYKNSMNSFYRKMAGELIYNNNMYILKYNDIKRMKKGEYKKFWKVYNKIVEAHPERLAFNLGSSELQRQIYIMRNDMKLDFSEIEKLLVPSEEKKYIETTKKQSEGDDSVLDIPY